MVRCFESRKDRFSCVSVDFFVDELESTDDLDDCLSVSISKWKEDGVSGVWLKIPLEKSDYIAVCVKHSFQYHHALPGHVVMQRWLPEDRPSTLPPYAFHHVAAAGLVVNQREEILVVKENFYPDCKWKLPGGSCDPGEDLGDTAIREVYEETGVRTEFVAMLAFRHMHKFRFGSSDIYFVCVLRPTTHEIRRDSREIKDARWMHIDDYLGLPDIVPTNRCIVQTYRDQVRNGHTQSVQPHQVHGGHIVYTVETPTHEVTHL